MIRTHAQGLGLAASILVFLSPAQVAADETGWSFRFTGYLFAAETSNAIGGLETVLSFSDALENLDFAFMGALEANNGPWSLIADYSYFDLTFSTGSPVDGFTGADTNVTNHYLSAYAAYRVYESSVTSLDLGGGFRWFDTDTQITLTGGPATPPASAGDDWIDPLIMARASARLSERWTGNLLLDYGGFSGDSETYQLTVNFAYALDEQWDLRLGYRYIDIDHNINGTDFRFTQSGPVVGFSYAF